VGFQTTTKQTNKLTLKQTPRNTIEDFPGQSCDKFCRPGSR